jgi:hypothetical protein
MLDEMFLSTLVATQGRKALQILLQRVCIQKTSTITMNDGQ